MDYRQLNKNPEELELLRGENILLKQENARILAVIDDLKESLKDVRDELEYRVYI